MSPETLRARCWHEHPIVIGYWCRDGKPYVSYAEACEQELREQAARDRHKARLNAEEADGRKESADRRAVYERHYVVPTIDLVKQQRERPKLTAEDRKDIARKWR